MLPYPVSANEYWRVQRGRVRVSKKALAYKADIGSLWRMFARPMIATGPVGVELLLHPRITVKGEESKVCLDLDNTVKVTLDALNGVAYLDDKQVRRLVAEFADPVEGGALSLRVYAL